MNRSGVTVRCASAAIAGSVAALSEVERVNASWALSIVIVMGTLRGSRKTYDLCEMFPGIENSLDYTVRIGDVCGEEISDPNTCPREKMCYCCMEVFCRREFKRSVAHLKRSKSR